MIFFTGLHIPYHAKSFLRCMISVNVLRKRRSDFVANDWIMDSGAFTSVTRLGDHTMGVLEYAARIRRWAMCGRLLAAVSQDYMCEPFALSRTGLSIADHQWLTISRYDALVAEMGDSPTYIMPVLQGFAPSEYVSHLKQYGDRLRHGQWVGVGSVCKRNTKPKDVELVLAAVASERPDLKLHGFGIKTTSLLNPTVRGLLYSADSMAWSFHARKHGRDPNSVYEAKVWARRLVGGKP